MVLTIASGKGGTGKTTIALALAKLLEMHGQPVTILDCDVEEPNVNLILKAKIKERVTVYAPIPEIDETKCNGCGKCEEICQFNAIILLNGKPLFFSGICHYCGGCKLICPTRAITDQVNEIGVIEEGNAGNIRYIGGRLRVSEAISKLLVKTVKKQIIEDDINIIDAPLGASHAVVESVTGSDYVLLVTEPTPFGLHDLKLSVQMIKELDLPFGVVINRADIGDSRVIDYCRNENIDLLAEIPHSMELARKYSSDDFIKFFIEQFAEEMEKIITICHRDIKTGILQ